LKKKKRKKRKKEKKSGNNRLYCTLQRFKTAALGPMYFGVVKLKNVKPPPFPCAYGLRQTSYLYIGQLTAKLSYCIDSFCRAFFIPVHFIDILYTLFSQRIKLYSSLDPFFKIEKRKEKRIPSAPFSL
jgi:hypothetical protein